MKRSPWYGFYCYVWTTLVCGCDCVEGRKVSQLCDLGHTTVLLWSCDHAPTKANSVHFMRLMQKQMGWCVELFSTWEMGLAIMAQLRRSWSATALRTESRWEAKAEGE